MNKHHACPDSDGPTILEGKEARSQRDKNAFSKEMQSELKKAFSKNIVKVCCLCVWLVFVSLFVLLLLFVLFCCCVISVWLLLFFVLSFCLCFL